MNLKIIITICTAIIILGFLIGGIIDEYIGKDNTSNDNLQGVLDYCDDVKNGLYVTLITLEFMNSTHHIDNTDCEWFPNDGYHDQVIPNP